MASKYRIEPSEREERELRRRAGQYTRSRREVVRAKIVLLAADGLSNAEIARRLDCTEKSVGKWRRQFFEEGLRVWMSGPGRASPVFFPRRDRRDRRGQGVGVRASGRVGQGAVVLVER